MWVEEAVRYYSILPSASLLQHIPQASSGNPLESLLLGFKALTQANFGSSVFVLGIHCLLLCTFDVSTILCIARYSVYMDYQPAVSLYTQCHAGAVISSLFYEELLRKFGSCGVSLVYGDVNRGKSKSVELALSVLGLRQARYSSIFDAFLRKLLLGAMPWCFHDPDDADQLQRLLLSVFGGNTIGNVQTHGSARVVPIATANCHIVEDLATRDERYRNVLLGKFQCYALHNFLHGGSVNTTLVQGCMCTKTTKVLCGFYK